jgi:hypothetical protein
VLRRVCRAAVLLVPACFHPSYDRPRCGLHGECPSGLSCSVEQVCEAGPVASLPDGGVLPDAEVVDLSPICASIALGNPQVSAAACATPTTALLRVAASASIDTDLGTSTQAGLTCTRVSDGSIYTGEAGASASR